MSRLQTLLNLGAVAAAIGGVTLIAVKNRPAGRCASRPAANLCRRSMRPGGKAELTSLPDIEIHGNSHVLMQDKNSLTIADWLIGWINHHFWITVGDIFPLFCRV